MEIIVVDSAERFRQAREIFQEYQKAIGVDLCFQDFETELEQLERIYTSPNGLLLFALEKHLLAGCVAYRRISETISEMKRLYVKPAFRGKGIGKALTQEVIKRTRKAGYSSMRLDTLPSMEEAIELYHSLGFREIEPYYLNPIAGTKFMELLLK